ncbi:hypothetical protein BJF90_32525 [Pseudonocardia sp. CNS-004]|nr:hypothetical protein BJF90_32525 [Pseudonocardia sp. CNS-004]
MSDTTRPAAADAPGRIVVGVDGSDESRSALQWAVRQAQRTGAAVHAVAVWQQQIQFGIGAHVPVPSESFESEARTWLRDALPSPAPDEHGAEVHTHTEQGDPTQQLLEHSTTADMLVLGNHGRGGVVGALLGSVAQRCAHHARCPVVLVPGEPVRDGTPERGTREFRPSGRS